VTFTPDTDFQGDATFDYTVQDSTGLTDTGSVTVTVSDLTVLFRINAAGGDITALPNDPYGSTLDWEGGGTGTGSTPSGTQSGFDWSVSSTNTSDHNIPTRDDDVPDYIPQEIYAVERWDPPAGSDMQWTFGNEDLPNGTYTVNILAGNGFGGTSAPGTRVFDISIEGEPVEQMLDLSARFGHQVGGFLSYQVQVDDGTLNVELGRGPGSVENPTINGIEILQGAVTPPVDPGLEVNILNVAQTVSEGGTAFISIATSVTVPNDEQVDLTYVIEGVTATPEIDYSPDEALTGGGTATFTGTATITGGSSDFQIPVDILPDELVEGDETFTVTIVSVSPNASIGSDSVATVTIADDDTVVDPPAPGDVLYRVNTGGPLVVATDGGPDWTADTGNIGAAGNSPFLASTSPNTSTYNNNAGSSYAGDVASAPGVPSSTPLAVFDTERYDPTATAPPLAYQFDVGTDHNLQPGDQVEVRLYFAEIFSGVDAAGERVFDVSVDGVVPTAFDDVDPFGDAGAGNVGSVRSFVATVDADGLLDIAFDHGVENPAIKAIEILAVDPSGLDTVDGTPIDGGDFSTDPASPSTVLLPEGGSTTIVSNLEGGHNDRDFITVTIPDGHRLADIILTDYVADPSNSGFLGLKLGSDFVVDPAIPGPGTTPDGVVEPGDLDGGYVFNDGDIGTDLLPKLNAPSFGFAGFDEAALTGDVTVWLNQGGDASQATLTFVTEEIPATGGDIVAAINAGGP
ncbi:MAG: malectin domain-containing carbohydrate-binding protein, partial [Actinomycetota bacterium]